MIFRRAITETYRTHTATFGEAEASTMTDQRTEAEEEGVRTRQLNHTKRSPSATFPLPWAA